MYDDEGNEVVIPNVLFSMTESDVPGAVSNDTMGTGTTTGTYSDTMEDTPLASSSKMVDSEMFSHLFSGLYAKGKEWVSTKLSDDATKWAITNDYGDVTSTNQSFTCTTLQGRATESVSMDERRSVKSIRQQATFPSMS
mmetsp:Transcript_127/g.235  ORF Transcript_127/g.235 Transcript_127/m.235 type:complete len:139 (+) Transcript_127:539-955(+)